MAEDKYLQNRQLAYDLLKQEGYTDIGDSAEKLFENRANAELAYKLLHDAGYTDVGKDYDEFAEMLYGPATDTQSESAFVQPQEKTRPAVQSRASRFNDMVRQRDAARGYVPGADAKEDEARGIALAERRAQMARNAANPAPSVTEPQSVQQPEAPAGPTQEEIAASFQYRGGLDAELAELMAKRSEVQADIDFVKEYERRAEAEKRRNQMVSGVNPLSGTANRGADAKWLKENEARYSEAKKRAGDIEAQIARVKKAIKEPELQAKKKAEQDKLDEGWRKAVMSGPRGSIPFNAGNAKEREEDLNHAAASSLYGQAEQVWNQGSKYDPGYDGNWLEQLWTASRQFAEGAANNIDTGSFTAGLSEGSASIQARKAGEKKTRIIDDTFKDLGLTDGKVNELLRSMDEQAGKLTGMGEALERAGSELKAMEATLKDLAQSGKEVQYRAYYAKYKKKYDEYGRLYKEYEPVREAYEKNLGDYETIQSAIDANLEKGLTDGERSVLDAFDEFISAKMERADDVSVASQAGAGAEQSAEFMLDFILTGGLGRAGTKAATKLTAKHLMRKLGKEAVENMAVKPSVWSQIAMDTVTSAARTAIMFPRNLAAYGEQLTEVAGEGKDQYGRYQFNRSKLNAAFNTALTQYIEYWSEGFGEYFGAAEQALFKNVTGRAPMEAIGKTLKGYRGSVGKYLDYGKFDGMFNEMLEEVVGSTFNALGGWLSGDRVGDKDALKDFFSGEQLATLTLSFLPMSAISAHSNIKAYTKMKERYDKAVNEMNPFIESGKIQREDLESLVTGIPEMTPEQIKDKIVEIADRARANNGGRLPQNFAQNLIGYLEGSFSMSLNNEAWEDSQEKMSVVNAYTEQYSNPYVWDAYDLKQTEERARSAASEAGFDDGLLDTNAYTIAKHAQSLRNSDPDKAQVLMDYASAKAASQGLKDGYDEETKQRFYQIEENIRRNVYVGVGNVTLAVTKDGKAVYITSRDAEVNPFGELTVPTGPDGLVTYLETPDVETKKAKASDFDVAQSMPLGVYLLNAKEQWYSSRQQNYEKALDTISPAGMSRAIAEKQGQTVTVRDGKGVSQPVEIVRMADDGRSVVIRGDKDFLQGLATRMGMNVPPAEQIEVPVKDLYDMLEKTADGSIVSETATDEGGGPEPAPARVPEPETPPTSPAPAPAAAEDGLTLDGRPVTVDRIDEENGWAYFHYGDDGDGLQQLMELDEFKDRTGYGSEPAPAPAPDPAPAPTPAPEAPSIPTVEVNGKRKKVYDDPSVTPEMAYDDIYGGVEEGSKDEQNADKFVMNRSKAADKALADAERVVAEAEAEKAKIDDWDIRDDEDLDDFRDRKADAKAKVDGRVAETKAALPELRRKAAFWKELADVAADNAERRDREAKRRALIEKYGVDITQFDLTPYTAEEAVAEYLGNGEGIIDLDDAKREVFRASGRVPSELFRHSGNGGILTKNGGRSVADVANDIVGEYESTMAISQDEVRDIIIDFLKNYTKTEMRELIFNNRLKAAIEEKEAFDAPGDAADEIPAGDAVGAAPEGTDIPETEGQGPAPSAPETPSGAAGNPGSKEGGPAETGQVGVAPANPAPAALEFPAPEWAGPSMQQGTVGESGAQIEEEKPVAPSETPEKSVSSQQEKEAREKFTDTVAERLTKALATGEKPYKSITDLRKEAREAGMEVDDRGASDILIQELVEVALVKVARGIVEKSGVKSRAAFNAICRLYEMQPTLGQRSSGKVAMQQYSTPLPMSFVAQKFAYNGMMLDVLEPTAGNGMLVFGIPASRVHANELDQTRHDNLASQGYKEVTQNDATQPFAGKYDAVIANPPFGSHDAVEFDGKQISGLDPVITLRALDAMKDDGKAAIIIGGNVEWNDNGAWKTKKAFFSYLYDHYNVKGVVNMSGDLYAKQGTTYPTMMILIDGRRSEEERAKSTVYAPVLDKAPRKAETQEDLFDIVNEIINDNRKTDGNEVVRTQGERKPADGKDESVTAGDRGRGGEPAADGTHGQGRGNVGGTVVPGAQGNAAAGKDKPDAAVRVNAPGQRQGTGGNVPGEGPRAVGGNGSDSGRGSVQGTDAGRVPGRETDGREGSATSSGNAGRESAESVPGRESSVREPVRVAEKRKVEDKNLPYVHHSGAMSLESVAPAAMVEAMDAALRKIEEEVGRSIDEFVMDELGYKSKDELYKALAGEQVDSVAMAIYQMKKGKAMIIGDQTGVGKGRQMAALIRWAARQGKKPIFMTQKASLFSDIYRDMEAVGSKGLKPLIINSVSTYKDKETGKTRHTDTSGVMLDAELNEVYRSPGQSELDRIIESGEVPDGYDYVVLTYSQLNSGDSQSRSEQKKKLVLTKQNRRAVAKAEYIRKIVGDNYLMMDESHTAAGKDSNSGAFLQSIMPSVSGVTFASATFAKRPDTMPIYAIKSAMSEANVDPKELIQMIERGGVTLQEIMARALTDSGQMVRRERDMSDVVTDWKTVDDPETAKRARALYDRAIKIFNDIIAFQTEYITPIIKRKSDELADVMSTAGFTQGTKKFGIDNPPFVSQTYNFTKQLMLALKVDAIADLVVSEIKAGRHPVVALENTFGNLLDNYRVGDRVEDTSFSGNLLRSLDRILQYTEKDADGNPTQHFMSPKDLGPDGERAYYELRDKIREATSGIFVSPLDAITMKLQENGYKVGEITGRKGQVVKDANGYYIQDREVDAKKAVSDFNNDKSDILIINKKGSTGISLHALPQYKGHEPRQRTMIIAQPLGDINDYMQMIGRIDRTGQIHRGYYINLSLPVPAELRFNMMLAAKLKSLNANTTTSQENDAGSVDAPDFLNKYGSQVVVEYLRDHPEVFEKLSDTGLKLGGKDGVTTFSELENYPAQEEDAQRVTGRVALFPVAEQEAFYNEIAERYNALIKYLDEAGENTLKITTLPLRAKTLSRKVGTEGRNPGGSNPFAQNSYVERVEVDVLRKPMKADEIRKVRENVTGGKPFSEYVSAIIDRVNAQEESRLKDENERYEREKAKVQKEIDKQVAALEANVKNMDEVTRRAEINRITNRLTANLEDKHNNNVAGIKNLHSRLREKFEQFNFDRTYLIYETLDGGNVFQDAYSPAMFLGYKTAKEGNNITQSTSVAVFATLDGRGRLEIKFTDGAILDEIVKFTNDNWWKANETTLDNWDSSISNASREERYMLTGNILQAWANASRDGVLPGRLVSYTDIDGNIKDGILMNTTWQPNQLQSSGVPINTVTDKVLDGETVASTDGDIRIEQSYGDWFDFYVPKSKKAGAKYFQNEDILSLTQHGEFNTFRGSFYARIHKRNIPALLNLLGNMGVRIQGDESENAWEETPRETADDLRFRDEDGLLYSDSDTAYHGSVADFDAFDIDHAGSGEGHQSHGFGHYVALDKVISEGYAWNNAIQKAIDDHLVCRWPYIWNALNEKQPEGPKETVKIYDAALSELKTNTRRELEDAKRNTPDDKEAIRELQQDVEILDKYKPLSEVLKGTRHLYTVDIPKDTGENYIHENEVVPKDQLDRIKSAFGEYAKRVPQAREKLDYAVGSAPTGRQLYIAISRLSGPPISIQKWEKEKEASKFLHNLGYVGIRYTGRTDGRCAVIFSNEDLVISNKETFREETDADILDRLDSEPTITTYRAMQFVPDPNGEWEYDLWDGKGMQKGNLYPPMSAKVNGEWRPPVRKGKWERSVEQPELAREDGTFWLDRGDEGGVPAAYNPYFHSSGTMLNDQFKKAQDRNNLVVVEVQIPKREVSEGNMNPYHAEKAKNSVGKIDWNAGVIQKQLTGTRPVYLSRWDKPSRIVPINEVADNVADMVKGQVETFPTNVVWPQLRAELEKRGVKFVKTDNKGNIVGGKDNGKSYGSVYGVLTKQEEKERKKEREKAKDEREAKKERILAAELEATENTLDRMSQELGIKINRIGRNQMPEGHKTDKGFYDTETGEMTICMDNVTDERDAIATVLHETVGHHGLRKLFGDRFNEAMVRIYAGLDAKGRAWVHSYMQRHNLQPGDTQDIIRGMEEYMSHLAERADYKSTVWDRIREIFGKIVDAVFGTDGFTFTDRELNYILRASYENLKNPAWLDTVPGRAKDTLMKRELGINETDPNRPTDPDGPGAGRLYRDGDSGVARDDYAAEMEDWRNIAVMENQNADLPVKIGMEKVMNETGKDSLPEDEDFLTRHNLASSRAETEAHNFELFHFSPMLEQVRAVRDRLVGDRSGKEARQDAYDRVLDYLYAVSGLERNAYKNAEIEQEKHDALKGVTDPAVRAQIEKRFEGRKKDWSGLTSLTGRPKEEWREAEADAQAMIDAFKAEVGDDSMLDGLWDRIRSCTDFSLDHAYKYGLLTKAEYEKLRGTPTEPRMWQYYLPLRGFSEETAEEEFNYETFTRPSANSVVVKKMRGRWTKADNPIANILNIAETEIVQGQDNWAKQALLKFVLSAGDNSLLTEVEPWYVKDPGTGKWVLAEPAPGQSLEDFERNMRETRDAETAAGVPHTVKKGRRGLKLDQIMVNKAHRNEHMIRLKVSGMEKMIWVNGNPALAKAVTGTGRAQGLQWLRRASRVLSNLFTTYSLDFTAKNLLRDTIYSRIALHVKEDKKYRSRFRRNWRKNFGYGAFAYPMVSLARRWENGELQRIPVADRTEQEQRFIDFMTDGGQTGYTIINSVSKIKKDLERSMRSAGDRFGSFPVLGWYADGVKTLNEAFELLTRFTAYQTSRDMGRSGQRAASDAKEISVNFNRRGAQSATGVWGNVAAYLGATHYFYNAGVQGFDNFLRLFKTKPGKMTAITAGIMMMGVLTPFINSMLSGIGGGGDGDDDWYWNLPEWVRRNNLILGYRGFYLAVPMPVEFRAPYGIGDISAAAFAYRKYPNRTFGRVALDIISTASGILPVNPVEGYTGNGNIGDAALRAVAPDAGMFFVDWATNRDYTGRPLWKENPFNETVPKSQGAYASTPKGIVAACQKLAEVSAGAIDIPPGLVRDFMNNYGGGFFRAAEDVSKMVTGIIGSDPERTFRWDDVPFFSGFTGHIDEDRSNSFASGALYEYKKLSEGIVRKMNASSNTDGITASMAYDHPEDLPPEARVQKILSGRDYELGRMYREGMNNRYKMKQYVRGDKAGQWYKSKELERKGVDALRKDWQDLREEWASMPDNSPEEKSARAEKLLEVDDARHLYYDAQADLAERLMEYEYGKR